MPESTGGEVGHMDCLKALRYLDADSGNYVESTCECSCHEEKREWYLSDLVLSELGVGAE